MNQLNQAKFIADAKQKHGDKYDYSKVVYINNLTEVSITCLTCNTTFNQQPKVHKRGSGCSTCSKIKCGLARKSTTEEFVEKAKKIHGDIYDYSKVVYDTAMKKVTIICKIHGDFQQTPNGHLDKKGCTKCATIKNADKARKTTPQFIEDSKQIHGDMYDYSKVDYVNVMEKVTITCKIHGDFQQTPNGHLSGKGCYYCCMSHKSNTEEFIEKAKQKHGDMYDYSKVVYDTAMKKVTILCRTHGVFEQTPNGHLDGQGCFICGHNSYIHSTADFIQYATEKHENKFDYSKVVYSKMSDKVTIICKTHGEFEQTPSNHITHSQGCQQCAGNFKSTKEEFIKKAKLVYNDKYDYSNVNYINNHTYVDIICPIHGLFCTTPQNHLWYQCKQCGIESMKKTQRTSEEEFIVKANKVHGMYTYSNLQYVNAKTKIQIECSIHGMFYQTPDSHLRGSGCPTCYKKYSDPQIKWLEMLSIMKGIHIQHAENEGEYSIPETKYKADGFCKETNTIYEFHGDFWHGNPKKYPSEKLNCISKKTFGELYKITKQREEEIIQRGYTLVTIWEYDWNKLIKFIKVLQQKFRKFYL